MKFCFTCGKEVVLPKNFNQEAVAPSQPQPAPATGVPVYAEPSAPAINPTPVINEVPQPQPEPAPAAPSFAEPSAAAINPAPVINEVPEPVQPQRVEPVYHTEAAIRPFSIPEEPKKEEIEPAPVEEPVIASPEPEEPMQDSVTIIYRPPVNEKEKPEPIIPAKSSEPKEQKKEEPSSHAIPAGQILSSSVPQEEIAKVSSQAAESVMTASEPAKPEAAAVKETPAPAPVPAVQPAAPAVNPAPAATEPVKGTSASLNFDYIFEQANLQRNANAAAAPKPRNRRRFDPETGLTRNRIS